jgi:hypothetical protein
MTARTTSTTHTLLKMWKKLPALLLLTRLGPASPPRLPHHLLATNSPTMSPLFQFTRTVSPTLIPNKFRVVSSPIQP